MFRSLRKPSVLLLALCSLAACKDDPPRILSISPSSGPQGGGTTISLSGVNFDSKTQLFVGGAPCTNVSLVSTGSLTGATPSTNVLGFADVTVKNDDGQRDKIANGFEYTNGTSSVSVSSVAPTSGNSGTAVTINGSGFQANATVTFGSASATGVSVVSATQITCTAPGGAGPVSVTVQNTDSSSGQLANAFTYPGTGTGTGGTKTITTFAGTGASGNGGDTGQATAAQLNGPQAIALAAGGALFVADTGNSRVRRIESGGAITTVAGASGELNQPRGLAVDSQGNLYIADTGNHVVRKLAGTTLSVFAGQAGSSGNGGENIAATSANLSSPLGLAVDSSNNVFIADSANNKVRVVSALNTITSFAGTGSPGNGGDTAQIATACALSTPSGVAIDGTGSVYIADTGNGRVRRVTAGMISTFAGGGAANPGDNGAATAATLNQPIGVAVDSTGGVVIADAQANAIRIVNAGTISLLAGNYQSGSGGDNGVATSASVSGPRGVAAGTGVYFIADTNNNKVRRVQ